jgi:hypothetical protein
MAGEEDQLPLRGPYLSKSYQINFASQDGTVILLRHLLGLYTRRPRHSRSSIG